MNDFAKFVRTLREEHGQTQAQLAQCLGISRVAWMKYENGQRKTINPEYLKKLSALFDVPEEEFKKRFDADSISDYDEDNQKTEEFDLKVESRHIDNDLVDLSFLPSKVVNYLKNPANAAKVMEFYINNT